MKKLAFLFGLLLFTSMATASAPPPRWFHTALVQAVDEPRVLVVGWSKDGKAAVVSPVDGEARGGTGLNLWVIDTVEDTVLKVVEIWSDEFDDSSDSPDTLVNDFESSKKAQLFLEAFAAAQIQPASPQPLEMNTFPLKTPQGSFTAGALVLPVGDELEGVGVPGHALDWRLTVRSAQGEKSIAEGHDDNAIDVLVKGYVASPWEQRILVVYGITHPGFEGEQPLTYMFSGCLLTKGFSKK